MKFFSFLVPSIYQVAQPTKKPKSHFTIFLFLISGPSTNPIRFLPAQNISLICSFSSFPSLPPSLSHHCYFPDLLQQAPNWPSCFLSCPISIYGFFCLIKIRSFLTMFLALNVSSLFLHAGLSLTTSPASWETHSDITEGLISFVIQVAAQISPPMRRFL